MHLAKWSATLQRCAWPSRPLDQRPGPERTRQTSAVIRKTGSIGVSVCWMSLWYFLKKIEYGPCGGLLAFALEQLISQCGIQGLTGGCHWVGFGLWPATRSHIASKRCLNNHISCLTNTRHPRSHDYDSTE